TAQLKPIESSILAQRRVRKRKKRRQRRR
nr:Chain I, Ribosomal protein S6 kinase alpha-1,Protein Tat [Homo sapiens]